MGGRPARLLDHHHEGRRAEVALGIVAPILDKYEKDLLEKAKEKYRAHEREPLEALLMLAQLVALGDLRDELELAVKRGNRAVDRLIKP